MDENTYDVVVVGGGAAGLSAALVLSRARRRVAVVDAGAPRNAAAPHMQGYLSRDGMPPGELLAVGRAEIAGYGAELIEDQVERVDLGFTVKLAGGRVLTARRVLVTTGVHDVLPAIPGVRERWGKDLVPCPYCHGHEVRDQPIGVLAVQPGAVHHALLVRQWSDDVVYFPNTLQPTPAERESLAARGIRIVPGEVRRVLVDGDRLSGVELADGTVIPRTAVFLRPAHTALDGLLSALGCATTPDGWVRIDANGLTSVPGLWAAGNVVDPRAQVSTAAGAGSATAIAINTDLLEEDLARAVQEHRDTAAGAFSAAAEQEAAPPHRGIGG